MRQNKTLYRSLLAFYILLGVGFIPDIFAQGVEFVPGEGIKTKQLPPAEGPEGDKAEQKPVINQEATVKKAEGSESVNNKESVKTLPERESFVLDGFFSTKYVEKNIQMDGDTTKDSDIYGYLRIDLLMTEEKDYEFHFFGTARRDLEGDSNQKNFKPTEDIGNTNNSSDSSNIYDAHLAINNPLSFITQIRLGRQVGVRDEPIFFDGLAIDLKLFSNLKIFLYGGLAVHFYEMDDGTDIIGGMGIDYRMFRSTKISLDYLYIKDERDLYTEEEEIAEYTSVKLRQDFSSYAKAMVKYRWMNGEERDYKIRTHFKVVPTDTEINLAYYRQMEKKKEVSNEMSPFYDILGESKPYHYFDAKVRQQFGENIILDIGAYQRELVEEPEEESAFNREYKRFFIIFEMSELLTKGLSISLTGEHWETKAREFDSTGVEASYVLGKKINRFEVSAGYYYSLYKYDYYLELGERTEVTTYFARTQIPLGASFTAKAYYELETGIERYQTYRVEVRFDF